MKRTVFYCPKCGGTNVSVRAWVNANTNDYEGDIDDDGTAFCNDCDDEVTLAERVEDDPEAEVEEPQSAGGVATERKEARIWEIYKELFLMQTRELRANSRPTGWGDIGNRSEILEGIWRMAAEMAEAHERGIESMEG